MRDHQLYADLQEQAGDDVIILFQDGDDHVTFGRAAAALIKALVDADHVGSSDDIHIIEPQALTAAKAWLSESAFQTVVVTEGKFTTALNEELLEDRYENRLRLTIRAAETCGGFQNYEALRQRERSPHHAKRNRRRYQG